MTVSKQTAEGFVFVKEEALPLRHRPLPEQKVLISSHADRMHPERFEYEEGADFIVDYVRGLVQRTKESRIPDWSRHVLYGINDFDHTRYGDYSNRDYTVYAHYAYEPEADKIDRAQSGNERLDFLENTIRKLSSGEEVLYMVYGDSISTGGEASCEPFTYYHRFAEHLTSLYPSGRIRIVNRAIGGEASDGGVQRFEADVRSFRPDLVSIGYGMNDQNKHGDGNAVSLADFESNLRRMIETFRREGGHDMIVVTPCEPNPLWRHTSGKIRLYADVIRRLSVEYGIGLGDANAVWQQELAAGKTPESLLLNNINHPNDYGHFLYYLAFVSLLQDSSREMQK